MKVFDRSLKALHRGRIVKHPEDCKVYYYDLGIYNLIQRLNSIQGKQFQNVCFIGPYAHLFVNDIFPRNFIGMQGLTIVDLSSESLNYSLQKIKEMKTGIRVVGLKQDEESWTFPKDYFNLIVNNFQINWLNQVHPTAAKWLESLAPDGALLGTAIGGDSLQELRICLSLAEQERDGGISTHVSPMLELTDIGNILNRLEYKLVTSSADANMLYFDDMFALMTFLQNIGENNAIHNRRLRVSQDVFVAASAIYSSLFTEKTGKYEGKIKATFDLAHYIAWKEHDSQQKPLKPGTRGVDIRTLANEIEDEDMVQATIMEDTHGKVDVQFLKKGKNTQIKP